MAKKNTTPTPETTAAPATETQVPFEEVTDDDEDAEVVSETALTTAQVGGALAGRTGQRTAIEDYAGEGFEGQTSEDTAIPFIYLLQAQSPAVVDKVAPGAEAGVYWNSVTNRIAKAFRMIPVFTRHEYLQKVPNEPKRGLKGGLVRRFTIDASEVLAAKSASKAFGKYFIDHANEETGKVERTGEEGDHLVETFVIYGIELDDNLQPLGPCAVPFKSTGIKAYKAFSSTVRSNQVTINGQRKPAPLFCNLVQFGADIAGDGANRWYKPNFTPAVENSKTKSMMAVDDSRFLEAYDLYRSVKGGERDVNYEKADAQDGGGGAKGPLPF